MVQICRCICLLSCFIITNLYAQENRATQKPGNVKQDSTQAVSTPDSSAKTINLFAQQNPEIQKLNVARADSDRSLSGTDSTNPAVPTTTLDTQKKWGKQSHI